MSKIVWAIALNPPAAGQKAQVSYAPVSTDVDAGAGPALTKSLSLATSDVFSFRILAEKAPCNVKFLVQGWIGGGCPPTINVALCDLGVQELNDFKLPAAIQPAEACLALQCHYHGTGLLVCTGKGVSMTLDLTATVNASGAYVAFESTGGAGKEVSVNIAGTTITV